jgi:hypothetical protein
MSRGPGTVERKVAELFRASGWYRGTDRSFTVPELCLAVFGTDATTRAQRVSVVRAARTAMRREQDIRRSAAPGILFSDNHLSNWRATTMPDGTLVFHNITRPARVWAVAITRDGLIWSEAEIVKITATRISVVYKGVRAPLHRPIGVFGSWWRGVRFVGERDGFTAEWLERQWREQFGHLFPNLMPLVQARRLLGLPDNYTEEDIIAAFRKAAKRCHPDLGGTAEAFRVLVEARDRLLAALGTSAPPPTEPDFTPRGWRTRYVSARSHTRRIGGGRKLLAG